MIEILIGGVSYQIPVDTVRRIDRLAKTTGNSSESLFRAMLKYRARFTLADVYLLESVVAATAPLGISFEPLYELMATAPRGKCPAPRGRQPSDK